MRDISLPGVQLTLSAADAAIVLDAMTDYHSALDEYVDSADDNSPETSAAFLTRDRADAIITQLRELMT